MKPKYHDLTDSYRCPDTRNASFQPILGVSTPRAALCAFLAFGALIVAVWGIWRASMDYPGGTLILLAVSAPFICGWLVRDFCANDARLRLRHAQEALETAEQAVNAAYCAGIFKGQQIQSGNTKNLKPMGDN